MNELPPPPSLVELVTSTYDGEKNIDKSKPDSIWKKWLSGLHEVVKELVANEIQAIKMGDSPSIDAFARMRVSNPETIFDSKQIHSKQPLFWDDQLISGSGGASTWSQDTASTVLSVPATTACNRVRQTFRRFNYQPGKSQLYFITGTLSNGGAGILQCMGLYDDNNGLFVQNNEGTLQFVRRSSYSGSVVNTEIDQADWNLDTFDGTGASEITLDATKSQILIVDFEWLGVGRVRIGWVIDGIPYYCHQFVHSNHETGVYMSTPNIPLRYEIDNDGTGAAASLEHICSTVISEGGTQDIGITRYATNGINKVQGDNSGTIYALIGLRLKAANIDGVNDLINVSMITEGTNDYEWFLIFNPTVAGTPVWTDETNSIVQWGHGDYASTPSDTSVTGGTIITGGFVKGGKESGSDTFDLDTKQKLGSLIDGTVDEVWLCVMPNGGNNDFHGSITWKEIS